MISIIFICTFWSALYGVPMECPTWSGLFEVPFTPKDSDNLIIPFSFRILYNGWNHHHQPLGAHL